MAKFKNNINILENVFGIRRVVDAKNKTILNLDENNNINIEDRLCFDFWKNGNECANCISMRALNENKSFSKFENIDDKVFMIIAAPIIINNNKYVVELVKDVSDDTIVSQFSILEKNELKKEINRLNRLVVTDELTSIYNRRYINEKLPYSINKVSKDINSLSIIIIDVNKFKYINDNYGHVYGDYVLKDISSMLKAFATTYKGWVARYGGDEFIMVFENTTEELTNDICSNIKSKIEVHQFKYDNTKINVSCSIGNTVIKSDDIQMNNIISIIDKKLYIDKNSNS